MHLASNYALSSPFYVPHYLQGDKISTILKAAKLTTVEPFWPGLFAKALGACDVKALITTIGSGKLEGNFIIVKLLNYYSACFSKAPDFRISLDFIGRQVEADQCGCRWPSRFIG